MLLNIKRIKLFNYYSFIPTHFFSTHLTYSIRDRSDGWRVGSLINNLEGHNLCDTGDNQIQPLKDKQLCKPFNTSLAPPVQTFIPIMKPRSFPLVFDFTERYTVSHDILDIIKRAKLFHHPHHFSSLERIELITKLNIDHIPLTPLLRNKESQVIGFCIEPAMALLKQHYTPIRCIVLCTESHVYIWDVVSLEGIPHSIIRLLEDPHYLKVGYNVKSSLFALSSQFCIQPKSILDLQYIGTHFHFHNQSVQSLSHLILRAHLPESLMNKHTKSPILLYHHVWPSACTCVAYYEIFYCLNHLASWETLERYFRMLSVVSANSHKIEESPFRTNLFCSFNSRLAITQRHQLVSALNTKQLAYSQSVWITSASTSLHYTHPSFLRLSKNGQQQLAIPKTLIDNQPHAFSSLYQYPLSGMITDNANKSLSILHTHQNQLTKMESHRDTHSTELLNNLSCPFKHLRHPKKEQKWKQYEQRLKKKTRKLIFSIKINAPCHTQEIVSCILKKHIQYGSTALLEICNKLGWCIHDATPIWDSSRTITFSYQLFKKFKPEQTYLIQPLKRHHSLSKAADDAAWSAAWWCLHEENID